MKSIGIITNLQISTAHGQPMETKQLVQAIAGLGLGGEIHAREGSKRQVLLMDEETLGAFGLDVGRVRENITTRGVDLHNLAEGQRLRAGKAILEITLHCAPCEFIEAMRPGLRAAMEEKRGMLARVVEGGEIRVGDQIEVL
jgi:MOSC domain-containing protein YiiM